MAGAYRTERTTTSPGARFLTVHHDGSQPEVVRDYRDTFADLDRRRRPIEIAEHRYVILAFGRSQSCLYDREGQRIGSSALMRRFRAGDVYWKADERIEKGEVDGVITRPVMLQNRCNIHWGHFLLESLSRAWAALEFPELVAGGALFPANSPSPLASYLAAPLVDILALNGLTQLETGASPRRLRIEHCFVPTSTFELGDLAWADPRHLSAPRRVSERMLRSSETDPRPLYFSRSRLAFDMTQREIVNEREFEARLALSGVKIFHPQDHDLEEQIRIVNAHSVFIGCWGSAFHNLLFRLPNRACKVYTICQPFMPIDHVLVNWLIESDAHYLHAMNLHEKVGDRRFMTIDIDAAVQYLRDDGVV